MKTVAATAALLLASTAMAAPYTHRRRAAYEQRLARRNATEDRTGKSNPPLAVNYNSMADTIRVSQSANVQYSSNWGGAVQIEDSGITEVSASANFPSVSVPSGGGSGQYGGSAWVGIDGDTCSSSILQTGFDWVLENGEATYAAWYEWLPEYSYNFDITVNPGDEISMKVVADSTTGGTAYITNESTGESVSHSFSGETALCEQNAEWIVEDFEENGSLIPFAAFDQVTFSGSSYTVNGGSKGLDGSSILDIKQGDSVLTDCSVSDSSTLGCSYTGN